MPKHRGRPRTNQFSKAIAVALVEPEFSINVGYVARIMANFGLSDLFIVSEVKSARTQLKESERFASHGRYILHNAGKVQSLNELRKKFKFLVGTTAIRGSRKSNLTRKTLDVAECAQRVAHMIDSKKSKQLCIVLGRDTTGLTNDELRQCDFSATIQTGSGYNTLNLSHALAILLYVFLGVIGNTTHQGGVTKAAIVARSRAATPRRERDRVISLFEQLAVISDFQEFKRGKLHETMSRLLSRSDPSLRELYLLMGLASKANSKIGRLSACASLERTN